MKSKFGALGLTLFEKFYKHYVSILSNIYLTFILIMNNNKKVNIVVDIAFCLCPTMYLVDFNIIGIKRFSESLLFAVHSRLMHQSNP